MSLCQDKEMRLGNHLELSDFYNLAEELKRWRTHKDFLTAEGKKRTGIILGFVKGLRLSARLIYAIRKSLSGTSLKVDWGHLLNLTGDSLSPECDIIIHKGIVDEWNGTEKPIMDFKFVKCDKVIAVISCKSFLRSIDYSYCTLLKPYVKEILLFAECCNPRSIKRLRDKAKEAGYCGLWYLYGINTKTNEIIQDPDVWKDFLTTIKGICKE